MEHRIDMIEAFSVRAIETMRDAFLAKLPRTANSVITSRVEGHTIILTHYIDSSYWTGRK